MSQVTHPTVALPARTQSRKALVVAGVLAVLATAAVVIALVLAADGGTGSSVVPVKAQPSLRSESGPNENAIAAAIGTRPTTGPNESTVAAAIGSQPTTGPDESRIASSISGR